MAQLRPGREVVVAGVGLHPFGRFPEKDLSDLALDAVVESLKDAGVRWRDIPIAYFGHVYYHGMSLGETTLSKLGLTGVPIINVENACSSGSTAFWQHTGESPPASTTWPWPSAPRRCRADR